MIGSMLCVNQTGEEGCIHAICQNPATDPDVPVVFDYCIGCCLKACEYTSRETVLRQMRELDMRA